MDTAKLHGVQKKVEYCLEKFPETRNDDIWLLARYAENFYPPFERPIYNWRDLVSALHAITSMDHLARCRRKAIRQSGYTKWLPTDKEVALGRKINEQVWKKFAVENQLRDEFGKLIV